MLVGWFCVCLIILGWFRYVGVVGVWVILEMWWIDDGFIFGDDDGLLVLFMRGYEVGEFWKVWFVRRRLRSWGRCEFKSGSCEGVEMVI